MNLKSRILNVRSAFFLALILRAAYLVYNYSLHLPLVWEDGTLGGLCGAEMLSGRSISVPISLEDCRVVLQFGNYGMSMVHLVVAFLFGKSSLWALSILQSCLDAMLIFPLSQIGQYFGERTKISVAFLYAIWPVAIFMAAVPNWYFYLNAGAIVFSYYFIESVLIELKFSTWLKMGLLLFVVASCRQTFFMFPAIFSLFLLLRLITKKIDIVFSMSRVAFLASLILLSLSTYNYINFRISNGTSKGRDNWSHSFFMGVGERENYFMKENQLDGSDQSVTNWYIRKSGDTRNFFPAEDEIYKKWLKNSAIQFIVLNPCLYLELYLKRLLGILFPNFRIGVAADVDAVAQLESPMKRGERLSIVKTPKRFTAAGLFRLFQLDHSYFAAFVVRILVMILLPLGMFLGIVFASAQQRSFIFLLATPLVGIAAVLSFIRLPNWDHAACWSLMLPVTCFGFLSTISKFEKVFELKFQKQRFFSFMSIHLY